MTALRSFISGRRAAVLSLQDEGGGLVAVVLGGAPPGDDAAAPLASLLGAAAAACGAAPSPERVALALDGELRRAGSRSAPVVFAAARRSGDRVEVCTAGDLRVHLVEDGRVTRVSRDHILRDDPDAAFPAELAATMPFFATRGLGGGVEAAPESQLWTLAGEPASIVLCSAELHRFCAPATYFPAVAAELAAGRAPFPADPASTTSVAVELILR